MTIQRFSLQKYSGIQSRYTCPNCNKSHQFTRYIENETGNSIAVNVGICNRVNKCGYHYSPKQYFTDHPDFNIKTDGIQIVQNLKKGKPKSNEDRPISYIDKVAFSQSLTAYEHNNLILYLSRLFNWEQVNALINMYKIGSSSRWGGGTTIFWQIDQDENIRTGKLIKYDSSTGKRLKKPFTHTNWVHALEPYNHQFNLFQCMFGEHLLKEVSSYPVGLVESEKTALIAQIKYPDFIWLATGGQSEFRYEKLKVLKGRRVVVFPDLGSYDIWKKKSSDWDLDLTFSSYLEENANLNEMNEGLDIADFLS